MIEVRNTPFDISMFDLTGKVAVITGSTTGLRYGMVVAFCAYGARAVISGLDGEDCKKISDGINVMDRTTVPFKADVRNHQEVQAIVAKTVGTFGELDTMVYSVDIDTAERTVEMSDDEWDKVVDTDLEGVFTCGAEVAKVMIEREIKGRVINISSVDGLMGAKNIAAYCAPKSGVISLSETEAMEWGCYGITTNAICPGYVPTVAGSVPLAIPRVKEQILARTALKRLGEAWEIVAIALFLASDASSIVTGACIAAGMGTTYN